MEPAAPDPDGSPVHAVDAAFHEGDAAPVEQDPGAAYEPCGYPVSCREGLSPANEGSTCVCTGRCDDGHTREQNAPGCPAAEGGAPTYCDAFGWCWRVCQHYGESEECPQGLACGLTYEGLRCVTTKAVLDRQQVREPARTIGPFELYGPCETFSERECLGIDTGTQTELRQGHECLCSAWCFEDAHCPAPPQGYGRAVCLHDETLSRVPGYCSISCDPERAQSCPESLHCQPGPDPSCKAFFYEVPPQGTAACRGGIYRHGDGDAVIEPGELYGPRATESDWCGRGIGTTTAGNGRCVPQSCCSDADCPAPPEGYGAVFCSRGDCYLSCQTAAQCPAGAEYACEDVRFPMQPPLLGCR